MELANQCCAQLNNAYNRCSVEVNNAYIWAAKTSGIKTIEKFTFKPTDSTTVKAGKIFAMTLGALAVLPTAALIGGVATIVKQVSEALKNAATSDAADFEDVEVDVEFSIDEVPTAVEAGNEVVVKIEVPEADKEKVSVVTDGDEAVKEKVSVVTDGDEAVVEVDIAPLSPEEVKDAATQTEIIA